MPQVVTTVGQTEQISTLDSHPDYQARARDWTRLSDCYAGDRQVKSKTTIYLPQTGGMIALGTGNDSRGQPKQGQALYDSYIARARYPDWYRSTVVKLAGLVTREDAVIEIPKRLEPLLEHATPEGDSLQVLLRKIFEHQLRYGRFGLLVDIDAERNLPYIATYAALSIVNWDDAVVFDAADVRRRLEFVLLDESDYVRDTTSSAAANQRTWKWESRARVLTLGPDGYTVTIEVDGSAVDTKTPMLQGRRPETLPFVFVNAMDLLPQTDEAPLIGLADVALQAYRTDADYRQALHNQGQDTLVVIGGTLPNADPRDPNATAKPDQIVGAGALISIPDPSGDAKFIGVESHGLAELRTALNDAKAEAGEYGGELLSAAGAGESGDALTTRVGARTANLPGLVKTGAKALETALRIAAVWAGENPDDVKVEANLDFVDDPMSGEEAAQWIGAKRLGFPVSMRTLHEMAQKRDATSRSFEDELAEIEKEEAAGIGTADTTVDPGAGGGDDGEDDDDQTGGNGNGNGGPGDGE